MSLPAKVKTFVSDGLEAFVVPFDAQDGDLRVFFSTASEERLLVAGVDHVFEVSGGARRVRLLKPLKGFVTVAVVPPLDARLQKFGVAMLGDLNEWIARVVEHIAFLECRIGLADLRPIGAPSPEVIAAEEADLFARALRFGFDVPQLSNPGAGCHILGWLHGKPVWTSPESIAARTYAVSQEAADTITLNDLKTRGVYFGRQPKVTDFLREVALVPCPELPVNEGDNWCELIVQPALVETSFELWLHIPAVITSAAQSATVPPACTYQVQAPIIQVEGCAK